MPLVKEDRSDGGPQGSGSDNLHRFGFRFRPIAVALNLLFVAAFALLQVWPLAAAYLGGIFLSAWMAIQARKRRAVGGLNWMWLLVLSQSMFAVVMIGAAAGFQYYAITTLPIIFANELWTLSAKVLQSALVALCLVLCVTYFADYRPFYLLTPAQIELWRAFNAVGTCTMLAALSANVYLTLKETQDSLAAANESLTLANAIQAQQKSELTRFLAVASHDLRQPMHALNIYLGALQNAEVSNAARNLLGKVRQCASIMDDMFLALLDLSRLDAGVVRPSIERFPIAGLLKTLAVEFVPQAEAKGLTLDCVPSDAWVESDAGLVQQILGNLIANAVRYTEKGSIRIHCHAADGRLLVAVQDSGIGISAHQQKTVFEEYFQLGNSSHDPTKGLGLGLAIVKRLSTLLGTPVTLVSEVGRGTTFTLDLPQAASGKEAQDVAETDWQEHGNLLEDRLILVLDDEKSILESMCILLEQWGCRVVAAQSGAEARAALAGEAPDMIVSDYRLQTGESGVDFITGLRDEYNRGIPALVVTGDTAPDLIRDTLSSGLPVMYKPVSATLLHDALMRVFAKRVVLI